MPVMIDFPTLIRLKRCGRFARFDDTGRLEEWTEDVARATLFPSQAEAVAAVRGIVAPEVRAAIRAGHAVVVEDDETGERHVVDAHDRQELYATPRIRLADAFPRYLDDDPARNAVTPQQNRRSAHMARQLTRELFAEAPRLNWPIATMPRITPARVLEDEYHMPVSARARRAGALARYTAA